ncbi:Sip1-related alpha-galactosidase [Neobacillus vireti]|uniref:Raffinose synthase n=1 Tax=Neobacillus vireti LMG 21834 TaxID=1131730 RepID=A0AB94IK80_9BACI|nr:Sip1-related alpha-galactosidase [Neobacillus vireti]ETI67511.1 raffinose synthase [Neobacillus vireti LMG 21834]KLT18526.1 hypothetical protein AA980_09510 [Neobacillus vireti]
MNQNTIKNELNLLVKGQTVLQGLNPSVTLDDHSRHGLVFRNTSESTIPSGNGEESYHEIIHVFSDQAEEISLALKFKIYQDIVFAYIDVKITNERIQNRHKYLAPEGGIIIHVAGLGPVKGLMANYQHKDWWTRPHFSTELETLPERTQSFLWKTDEEFYYYLLPVVDKVYRTELAGSEQGIDIKLSSYAGGYDECHTLAFAIGIGENPFDLSKQTIANVLKKLNYPTLLREKKRYPEMLDSLGWCSWDAFYHEVSENGIIEKMDELREKELPVKWVMIDDGWLSVEDNRLRSFEADRIKFPKGLSSISTKLKKQYGVSSVGVWHTIAGYWGGVHPELAKKMSDSLYETNSHKFFPHPDANKGFNFWDAWHSDLKKQGIDFVKVDSQSAVNNFMMYQKSIGEAARGAHASLEASVGIHFDQAIINCMGMAAENIFNRPASSVSRNSDDFVPGEEISFKEHALQNAYNSYYHGNLYWGDWDMFWTDHEEDVQNAVLRAVSGGPVYFSDRVGETDTEKIWPLIWGDGKILRADQPGLPTEDCLFVNPNHDLVPLKVWNTSGNAGIIAAFNIHLEGKEVAGKISPSDISLLDGDKFLVYDFFKKEVIMMSANETFEFKLQKGGVALYSIIPVQDDVTAIGLVNKYIVPKTISQTDFINNRMTVQLKEGGEFLFYTLLPNLEATINGTAAKITPMAESTYMIDCSKYTEAVIIDIFLGK